MKLKAEAARAAVTVARDLRAKGVPPGQIRAAVMHALHQLRLRRSGMGEDIFNAAPEKNVLQRVAELEAIKKARETVSPWLWVLSIASFAMATINRRQIALMFGRWKRRNQKALA